MAHERIPGGIYPPTPTFFAADGTVDLPTLHQHIAWLITHDLAGVLALGSNGEAMHLDDAERVAVIRTVREAMPVGSGVLLAGVTDLATRGTIHRAKLAKQAGADIAVVLPPFAFPGQMSPAALTAHFLAVADASPLPVLIYNMPANTANLDLTADVVIALAEHPNIIGVKDSSGQVAKLARIASATTNFTILAGSGSFLIPTLAVGGHGAIAAVANIIPAQVAAIYALWQARFAAPSVAAAQDREQQAQHLQAAIIPFNQAVTATFGVAGLKAALDLVRGYGGQPRAPLLPLPTAQHATLQALYASCISSTDPLLEP